MSIEAQLDGALKDAMRAKDADRVACIRQVRSKVQEAMNAPDFKGPSDDAFYQRIIASYVKSLEKSMVELAQGGERSKPLRDKYEAEVTYLKAYLPKQLSEAETKALVDKTIASLGAGPGQAGKVMGAIMKDHKGQVDSALVKRLAEEALKK